MSWSCFGSMLPSGSVPATMRARMTSATISATLGWENWPRCAAIRVGSDGLVTDDASRGETSLLRLRAFHFVRSARPARPMSPRARLAALSLSRDDYLARFDGATDAAVAAGFVLAADADEIKAIAAAKRTALKVWRPTVFEPVHAWR